MTSTVIFMVAMYIGYTYLVFELIDTLLKMPRLKKIFRIPIGIVNTLIASALTMLVGSTSLVAYIIFGIVLFVEFRIFYRDKYACSLFCMLACFIHMMSVRALCVALFAVALNTTIFDIVSNPFLLDLSSGVTFMLLNIIVFFIIKLIPAKSIRIINQHSESLQFMITWLSVFCAYLLINSRIYSEPNSQPTLLVNQIVAPIVILIGAYIVFYFSVKTGELLGYKSKNEELLHKMEKEHQYRSTIDKGVFRIIEVNYNKGEIISGFEDYEDKLGDIVHDYGKMLEVMIRTTIHPEDRDEFTKYLSPLAVVEEFEAGVTEIVFDYRRLMPDGNYIWMRVLMVLMQDEKGGDVRGFVQIKDIDAEKKLQLELKYKAERDLLTGLYNKGTTEMLITKKLNVDKKGTVSGVLFIIDIDNFKTINDRLGHLYGDAVLSELSESLRKVFRDCDIVGRIGGDEFLVFVEGEQNEELIVKISNNICTAFLQTYANEKNEGYTVSSSIGIAIFPTDGEKFEVLFKCADAALYTVKARGKNGYAFYDENTKTPYVSTRTEIDTHGVVQKNFKDNRIEYVFRLLYGSDDTKSAIESTLELIAKNFGFSRANIFEFNDLSTHFNGVFEWCTSGIDSVSANYINMPVRTFSFVISALEASGGMFFAVPDEFPEPIKMGYTEIGIKSIVHFSIVERDKLIGVIAFQYCADDAFQLSDTEFEELRTICQVLSVFIAKQLSNKRELSHHRAIETVMDNLNSISYVIDRETYEVYYENQNTVNVTGHPSIGTKCYFSYRGFDSPCEDCPTSQLSQDVTRCSLELYTAKFDIYTKTVASLIDWPNGREAMLISSVDITEYKPAKELDYMDYATAGLFI